MTLNAFLKDKQTRFNNVRVAHSPFTNSMNAQYTHYHSRVSRLFCFERLKKIKIFIKKWYIKLIKSGIYNVTKDLYFK